eukprot:EC714357.1.p3 GENE.EC714357.1~~EC714357.1.p3  ORF type:complete len:93 (-),score=20.31 EC714357.1:180-458(-)
MLIRSDTLEQQTAVLAAGRGETAELAMLHDRLADPVDAGIGTDGGVAGVHEDDLEPLVGCVLVDPVRVEHAQRAQAATNALLSNRPQVALDT